MSVYATPLLYLNMGGEMLYVLQQRLKAQKIELEKTIQVLDDVTAAFLNPKILSIVFGKTTLTGISSIRSTLECVALSSIMKLDEDSMDKLFDLMIMMTKFQMTAATGPREIILITLNHTDALRNMVTAANAQECVSLIHQMVVNYYCELTHDEIWEARKTILKILEPYKVRVSILLRMELQNEDASFNLPTRDYDEHYKKDEQRVLLQNLKLKDPTTLPLLPEGSIGSFELFGDRITSLGKNIYLPTFGALVRSTAHQQALTPKSNSATKAELEMLATQLGTGVTSDAGPFNLNLLLNIEPDEKSSDELATAEKNDTNNDKNYPNKEQKMKMNEEYKNKLVDNVYSDFDDDNRNEKKNRGSINLLELLDAIDTNDEQK